ncbi:MAG: hypothetical protein JKY93_12590 [Gammaproteobacteria bacterium]|nr:hypothetical protein [Gammaproteobacteria bacterium]
MAKGFDQLTNTGLHGNEDELISSRMGKAVRDGRCMGCFWLCRLLHLLDKNHCKKSIEDDEG